MQSFLVYILQVAGCVSIALLFYKGLLEKKTRAKTIRLYFIIAMLVSLLAPLSPLVIHTSLFAITGGDVTDNMVDQTNNGGEKGIINGHQSLVLANTETGDRWDVVTVLFYGYLAIAAFFLLRMVRELYAIVRCYRMATKEKWNNLQIVWNDQ